MMEYYNTTFTFAELRAVADEFGMWRHVSSLKVLVRSETTPTGVLLHDARSKHKGAPRSAPATDLFLRDAQGHWCACLGREYLNIWVRHEKQRSGFAVLSLLGYAVALRRRQEKFVSSPNTKTRAALQDQAHPTSYYSAPGVMSRHFANTFGAADQPHLKNLADRIILEVCAPAVAALDRPDLNKSPQKSVLRRLVKSTWVGKLERDESLVLVGLWDGFPLSSGKRPENDLLLTSVSYRSNVSPVTFHVLPRYAVEYLLRTLPAALGESFQHAPFDPEVSLADLAALWTPLEEGSLCDLSRAVVALKAL